MTLSEYQEKISRELSRRFEEDTAELQKEIDRLRGMIYGKKSFSDFDKKNILQEADELVNGDRMKQYAPPKENFKRISDIASVLCNREITPIECAKIMVSVKLGRAAYKFKRDNLVDAAGYLHIWDLLEE
jgi:hypothetical protein